MELPLVLAGVAIVVVLAVVVPVVVVVRRSRRAAVRGRVEQERIMTDRMTELTTAAGSALVSADEHLRLADDELGFAIAEFGEEATAEFAAALSRSRQRLAEAFHLNQLISDHVPDTDAQRQEWNERIVALCRSAEASVRDIQSSFAARRTAERRTPSEIENVRAEIGRVRQAIPGARETIEHLSKRYSDAALQPVSGNADQAEQLLEFSERSIRVAQSRLTASRTSEAGTVASAGAETIRRAKALIAAVDAFEVEALHAEATLTAIVAESRSEIGAARAMPETQRRGRIDAAITALEGELAALPASGARIDPVGSLSTLRAANTALDDAVAEHADRIERKERLRAQLVTAIDDAERQIAAARELVTDYRAPIGPDARTRLAEAERELAAMTDEREPEPAIARARRAASLAADAAGYARADVENARSYGGSADSSSGGWDGRRSGGGGAMLGGVLGGLAIGGLLDGLGDVGDFFD